MRQHYKNLFFDLDNTLWDFDANAYAALQDTFKELKIDLRPGSFDSFFRIYSQINNYYWDLYRRNKVTKEILTTRRFEDSLHQYGMTPAVSGKEIHERFIELMPTKTQLTEGTIETLPLLYKQYRLFIITNGFKEAQYHKLQTSGIAQFFEKVFISEEIRAPKPSKEIFEYAIKTSNARKAESLMIGDSWEVDIIGAKNVGIDQIYYCPTNTDHIPFNEQIHQKTNTFIIHSIDQLLLFL